VLFVCEVVKAPELVWTLCRRGKSHAIARNLTFGRLAHGLLLYQVSYPGPVRRLVRRLLCSLEARPLLSLKNLLGPVAGPFR
jgi:hypothetical protein